MATAALEHLKFPNESAEYRSARNALLEEERALRRQIERVAAQRRALPPGGELTRDYRFEGPDGQMKLSELFAPGKDILAIYSFMFGPERTTPCPGCTHFLDALDGQVRHIEQRMNFYVTAKSPIARLTAFARERGWNGLHLLSTDATYERDYFGDSRGLSPEMREQQRFQEREQSDMPMLNIFHREGRIIRHSWGSELLYVPPEPGQHYRHNDLLDPLWNMLDLTPEGRGDFFPKVNYD